MVCDKYKEQRALYFVLWLCCAFSQHSDVSDSTPIMERRSSCGEKYVTEDEISAELLANTLSDVPDNGESDSENDSDSCYWKYAKENCVTFTELQGE